MVWTLLGPKTLRHRGYATFGWSCLRQW